MTDKNLRAAAVFFAMALGLSWLFTIPLALSGAPLAGSTASMAVYALGGLGPAVAAILLLFHSFDRVERREYWRLPNCERRPADRRLIRFVLHSFLA